MAKYLFPPERFAEPYATIPIGALVEAMTAKKLGRVPQAGQRTRSVEPISNCAVWTRKGIGKGVVRTKALCEQLMLGDLRAGALVAHIHSETTGQFRRIASNFWSERFAGLTLGSVIFDLGTTATFPPELEGSSVYVTGDNAENWLKSYGITEEDAFFPDDLRSQRNRPAPRRTRYDWTSFENEAVSRLHDEGAFQGRWRQARLEEGMLSWCQKNWGQEPSLRIVRSHVKTAVRRFMKERKLGALPLGN